MTALSTELLGFGATGPTGATGSAGAAGATGPTGPNANMISLGNETWNGSTGSAVTVTTDEVQFFFNALDNSTAVVSVQVEVSTNGGTAWSAAITLATRSTNTTPKFTGSALLVGLKSGNVGIYSGFAAQANLTASQGGAIAAGGAVNAVRALFTAGAQNGGTATVYSPGGV